MCGSLNPSELCTYQRPSQGGGGDPGDIRGIARDFLAFVANVWPETGALDRFCTSEARYTGKDTRELLQKDPDRGMAMEKLKNCDRPARFLLFAKVYSDLCL